MIVLKSKYLVLQQTAAFPKFLLDFAKEGGDRDQVVVSSWPYVSY
jgi:hypothetical protein